MLVDYHCSNPACDCQDVYLDVTEQTTGKSVAKINFDLTGKAAPYLDKSHPHSSYAEKLFDAFQPTLSNPEYIALLRSHYREVKAIAASPTSEQQQVLVRFQE